MICFISHSINWLINSLITGMKKKPAQLNPSPVNPVIQAQLWLPGKFVQSANSLQFPLFTAHSSISEMQHTVQFGANNWPAMLCGWAFERGFKLSYATDINGLANKGTKCWQKETRTPPLLRGIEILLGSREAESFCITRLSAILS